MRASVTIEFIETLWTRHAHAGPGGEDVIALEALQDAMAGSGLKPDPLAIRQMLNVSGAQNGLLRGQFFALMASMCGDIRARLQVAYDVFDANGDGRVTPEEIHNVLVHFAIDRRDVASLLSQVDREGAGSITFEDFCALMPETHPQSFVRYSDRHSLAATPSPPLSTTSNPQRAEQKAARPKQVRRTPGEGTSRLQMQIGLFRLLQGAAYRSFRENCAANCETHLRAKALPYTITHFVAFANAAIALYKALGIVEPACHPALDAVNRSLQDEFARLQNRIANWQNLDKTPQMEAAQEAMTAARRARKETRDIFAAGVELALTLRRKNLDLSDLVQGRVVAHELTRQRNLDLHFERAAEPQPSKGTPSDYLQSWNHVVLEDTDEEIDGAMMPAAYWYEDFMPKLLAACSLSTAQDIRDNTEPDEAALDDWFENAFAAGEFDPFGEAVATHFTKCTPIQKLEIRQAWRLTRHYLNGVQKRRERLEFGRETGFLCEYVAFLDVYLDRSDVRDAQMRVSFPYFIGPPTWRFLHTAAEIICGRPAPEQSRLIKLFKDFFLLFATMYPCPYCRYHLNRYVVHNREVEMYPLEYLLLGSHPEKGAFEVSIGEKLETITDGNSLRLFLWKLHNAVSSSIARTEAWYRSEEDAPYTTRHWPNLETERMRAQAFGPKDLSETTADRLKALQSPIERLASLRQQVAMSEGRAGSERLSEIVEDAYKATSSLEDALAETGVLEQTYRFDPGLKDDAPHFTPEEEAFSRSGHFVEV